MPGKFKAFKKLSSDDALINRLQENVQQALLPVSSSEIIDGILLKNVELVSATDNAVQHKLGRVPLGWAVVGKRSQADVWDGQSTNSNKSLILVLRCSANVVVDLWVF